MMPQPLYSPFMAPCDLFLFSKIKRTLKSDRLTNMDKIKNSSLRELKLSENLSFRRVLGNGNSGGVTITSNRDYFEQTKLFPKTENSHYFLTHFICRSTVLGTTILDYPWPPRVVSIVLDCHSSTISYSKPSCVPCNSIDPCWSGFANISISFCYRK